MDKKKPGPKPKPAHLKSIYKTYSLPPDIHAALVRVARKYNRPMSQIVGRGIELAVAEIESK